MKFSILRNIYFLVLVSLLLYSFTQIDLSLTLSRVSFIQTAEKWFQQVGYFHRPLSTNLFIAIFTLLALFYVWFLKLAEKGKLTIFQVRSLILGAVVILLLSYNAFSYDLFNYIFDAKIIVHYHQNPYVLKALDFPKDPMLSFMHSTHRTFPYGPVWLLLSFPLSFLGFDYLIPTLVLFKLLAALAFLGTCYFIYKILQKTKSENSLQTLIIFALNPLVIIESLVSAHNDIVMVFVATAAAYCLISKKTLPALLLLVASIVIKLTAIFLVPVFLFYLIKKQKEEKFLLFCALFMILATIAVSLASGQNKNPEIQPWYFISFLPFVSLIKNKLVWTLSIFSSLGIMFSYVPYLFNGQWPSDIVMLKNELAAVSLAAGLIFYYLIRLKPSGK